MSIGGPLSDRYRTAGWIAWFTLTATIVVVVAYSIVVDQERSVTPAYRSAVIHWFAGEPLYNMHGHGFLYLPQAALTFAPWGMLPHWACEQLWRLTLLGVLAASVVRMNRSLKGDGRSFLVISLSTTVLAWGCARNGQATLMITALMILAAVDISEKRWWRAAILLSIGFAFKPLVIVMILLAAAIYPQMTWRLAAGLVFVGIVPFLMQRPDYVISQYYACAQSMSITFEVGETEKWAQLFGMLQVAGIELPEFLRTSIRIFAAIATLGLCWRAERTLSSERAAFYLFSLSACYLMLFNSRTEGNTYAMVGPVYGAMLAEAAFRAKDRLATGWLIAALALSVLNFELAILISPRPDAIWISPLVCACVTYYLVVCLTYEVSAAKAVRREPVSADFQKKKFKQHAAA